MTKLDICEHYSIEALGDWKDYMLYRCRDCWTMIAHEIACPCADCDAEREKK